MRKMFILSVFNFQLVKAKNPVYTMWFFEVIFSLIIQLTMGKNMYDYTFRQLKRRENFFTY